MHTFCDAEGRAWSLKITVAALERVQAAADVDLAGLLDAEKKFAPLAELLSQPVRLARVLWALCEPEAKARGVTPEQFGEALYGDALEAAANALVDELVFFTPNPSVRRQLAEVIRKSRQLAEEMLRANEEKIRRLDPSRLASRFVESPTSSAD